MAPRSSSAASARCAPSCWPSSGRAGSREGRAGAAAQASGAVGAGDTFPATAGGVPVEVHVFEDALLVVADSAAERISFSFVTGVAAENYAVTVMLSGGAQLALSRL